MSPLPRPGEICSPELAQQLALLEALRGAGYVAPNPLVGCAIIRRDNVLLATGYHARYGEAHAEVNALDKVAAEDLVGATVYVTLEPCSHHGKTPPCADRLIRDRVGKVVIAVMDPNPLVAGQGIKKLEDAGIEVVLDAHFAASAQRVAEHFLWNMRHKLPFITLKIGMSLDGKLALRNGESQWITGEPSRELGRVFRAHHDATLVGAQTVLKDNPTLDFRGTKYAGHKQNKILIWDPQNKLHDFLPTSNLAKAHTLKNIQVLRKIDLSVLQDLYKQGINSIYVEGGGKTISTFIEQKLFQKMYVFVAPVLLGNGLEWTSSINLSAMAERQELEFAEATPVYKDILFTVYPKKRN